MDVNPCKKKHVTNMRSSSSDEAVRLTPPRIFSLEQALEWINDDELVEVTLKAFGCVKTILDRNARAKAAKNKNNIYIDRTTLLRGRRFCILTE